MMIAPDVLETLRDALDRIRYQNELPNDQALAEYLGVSTRMISHWRNGKLTAGDKALALVLVKGQRQPSQQVAA